MNTGNERGKLVIFGNTEFAQVAAHYFNCDSRYRVAAFAVDNRYLTSKSLVGLPVISFENIQDVYPPDECDMFVAVGYKDMNRHRESKCIEARKKGYRLASYISSKCITYEDLKHGYNCFVLEGNIIQPFAELGNNVVLMNGNLISHHSIVCDNCFISANVTICGKVTIKNNCFLGANSCVRDGVTIEPFSLIGACAYISHDTKEKGVYISESTKRIKLDSDHYMK